MERISTDEAGRMLDQYCAGLRAGPHRNYPDGEVPSGPKVRQKLAEAVEKYGVFLPRVEEKGAGRTWIWSDHHLWHANIIKYCKRPFADEPEMTDALYSAWTSAIREEDTVILGGDIAMRGALQGRKGAPRRKALESLPGKTILVVGNHDTDKSGRCTAPAHRTAGVVLINGEPKLAVTHIPLTGVPDGWVNVYGHVHNNDPPMRGRYINMCVEETGYKPVPLEDVRMLARALARGETPDGDTTAERIVALKAQGGTQ